MSTVHMSHSFEMISSEICFPQYTRRKGTLPSTYILPLSIRAHGLALGQQVLIREMHNRTHYLLL